MDAHTVFESSDHFYNSEVHITKDQPLKQL